MSLTPSQAAKLGLEWCDFRAHWVTKLDDRTGWCAACTWTSSNTSAEIADDDERERLARREEETLRLLQEIEAEQLRAMQTASAKRDQLKTARKRMREDYNANPRKGRTK